MTILAELGITYLEDKYTVRVMNYQPLVPSTYDHPSEGGYCEYELLDVDGDKIEYIDVLLDDYIQRMVQMGFENETLY